MSRSGRRRGRARNAPLERFHRLRLLWLSGQVRDGHLFDPNPRRELVEPREPAQRNCPHQGRARVRPHDGARATAGRGYRPDGALMGLRAVEPQAIEFCGQYAHAREASAPFVLFSLPRSRSAWLSVLLSRPGALVGHDIGIGCAQPEDFAQRLRSDLAGTCETGAAFAWRLIRWLVPDARFAVVRRP